MEPFSVRVEVRAPHDAPDVLTDDAVDELMDRLEEYDGIVSSGPRSWDATVTIDASNPHQAIDEGARIIEHWAAKSGMPSWPTVLVEAIRQDVLAEQLARPTLPDLVSAPEAADILGVRPQRLHQLADERKDFPEPAYELRAGKLWLRAAIEAFAQRKRQPGRPRGIRGPARCVAACGRPRRAADLPRPTAGATDGRPDASRSRGPCDDPALRPPGTGRARQGDPVVGAPE